MQSALSRAGARADALLADERVLPAVLLLLALVAYAPHLSNGFVWDDLGFLVQNPSVNGSAPWSSVFTRDAWWAQSGSVGSRVLYYRPLFVAMCRLLWAVGGGSPVAFHASALVLHLCAALLGARLLAGLGAPRAVATAASLLFFVNPLAGEVVHWASAMGEAAMLVAAIGAILALRGAREGATPARRRWWRAAAAGCVLLALGMKETAVVVPALAIVEALLAPRVEWRERLVGTWPAWLPVVAWMTARTVVAGGSGAALSLDAPAAQIARVGSILAWDLRRLAYPFPLSPGHDLPLQPDLVGGIAALGALAIGLGLLFRGGPRRGAWALLVLLPLTPPLAQGFLSLRSGMPVAERYLYLSLFPFLAGAVLAARATVALVRWPPGVAAAATAAAVAVSATAAGGYGRHFAGNEAYAARILSIYPGNAVALTMRGQRALARGDLAAAARDFDEAVRSEPRRPLAHLNVAVVRERRGDLAGAEVAARLALTLDDRLAAGHALLARLLRDQGRMAEAGPHFEAAARLAPEDAGARADLGTWLFIRGDVPAASAEWEQGLLRAPGSCELLFNLAMAKATLGLEAEARERARRFLASCREGYEPQRAQAAAWAGR